MAGTGTNVRNTATANDKESLLPKFVRDRELPHLLLVAAVTLASWCLLIVYGLKAFPEAPLYDDWSFIDKLHGYISGQMGISYFFLRHNGHPYLATRLAYYVDYYLTDLDLLYIRWLMVAVICMQSAMIGLCIVMTRSEHQTNVGLNYLGAAIAVMCTTTLAQWEHFTLSISLSNVLVNLLVFASLIALQYWLRTGKSSFLLSTLLLSLLASYNTAQGFVVWLALAVTVLLADGHVKSWRLIALFSVCFIVFFVAAAVSTSGLNVLQLNPLQIVKSLFMLAGLSLFGQYHNAPVTTVLEAGGLILAILGLLMLAEIFRNPSERRTVAPFVGYFIYGCVGIVLVALGRQGHPMDASRYGVISVPITIGLIGTFSVARGRSSALPLALGALAALAFVGVAMADLDEFAIAEARKNYVSEMATILKTWDLQTDPGGLAKTLHITVDEMPAVARGLGFLRSEHLSYLRGGNK
jgi:hypothetical protein